MANGVLQTKLLKETREVSDFAHGGQVLISNQLYTALQSETGIPDMDQAAVGAIKDISQDDSQENALCCVQLLPRALDKRLGEFMPMYEGQEDLVRPPAGMVTFVFTGCPDSKLVKLTNSELSETELSKVDAAINAIAEETRGYECKGSGGKYLIAFSTAEAAVRFATMLNAKLMATDWDPGLKEVQALSSRGPLFNGLCVAIGMSTGEPTMFNFNKSSNRMDYFGPVVNKSARVNAVTAPGETCFTVETKKQLELDGATMQSVQSRGLFQMKGIKLETEVFNTLPEDMVGRREVYESVRAGAAQFLSPSSPSTLSPNSE